MVTTIKFPSDHVEENADEISDSIVDIALDILDVWDPSERGKAPSGVAATAVYVASMSESVGRSELTQHQLCDMFGTSPMTIRKQKSECISTARENGLLS